MRTVCNGLLLMLAATLAAVDPALAQEKRVCPPRWGKPGAPLVPDPETAKQIFIAVEARFYPKADRRAFPVVETTDKGATWAVWRTRAPSDAVVFGGGQLSMEIAKCDAAISNLYFTR